jgi:small subunit ribosomal protein S17
MHKKILSGIVVKTTYDKTVTISIKKRIAHKKYTKSIKRDIKYLVHDENNFFAINEEVKIIDSRPMSKLKNWRVVI